MAEVATNPLDSTHLTVETPINIDTLIYMLNSDDMPMLGGVNSDGYPMVASKPVDQTVFYWMNDEFLPPRTTLGAAIADGSTTSVTLATDKGESFAAGDVIKIDDELLKITAVSNDTLTVTRGFGGTTGAAHADASDVIGIGTVLAEGSIGDEQFTGRTKVSNYTQIWTSQISITRTARRIPKYGLPGGELPRQIAKIMFAEGVNLEQSFLYGVKYQSGNERATGGLTEFLTSNVVGNGTSGDWLTARGIEEQQQVAYNNGGMFHRIVGRPDVFNALNNLEGDRIDSVDIMDVRRGRVRAQVVVTEFGDTYLHRNRYVKRSDAFGLNDDVLLQRVFQPMVVQPLAKTDDKDNWMFVCEKGWQVQGERHQVYWSGLNPDGELPAELI